MAHVEQQQIKWANTLALFGAIVASEADMLSRAELASASGLSLMTVGKIVDALDAAGAVVQVKDERISAGRTARLVALSPERHMLVLDLCGRDYRLCVLDLRCRVVDEVVYPYDDGLRPEENLTRFLANRQLYLRTPPKPAACLGVGVLLPGAYDAATDRMSGPEQPASVPIFVRKTLAPLFGKIPLTIRADAQAAVMASIAEMGTADDQLWLSLDRPICGALVMGGRPMLGAHGCAGHYGALNVGTSFTLEEAMLTLREPAERGAAVAVALYSLIAALDPASVRLESRYGFDAAFLDAMQARLERLGVGRRLPMPSVTASRRDVSSPVLGIAAEMREAWLLAALGG